MKNLFSFYTKSLKNQLIVPLVSAFLLSTFFITTLVLYHNNKIVEEILLQLRTEMLTLVKSNINNKINEAIQLNQINYFNFHSNVLSISDEKQRERYFYSLIKNFDDVAMTYIGLPSGEFYGARRNPDKSFNIVKNNLATNGDSEYYSVNEFGDRVEKVQTFKNFDPRKRPWYKTAIEKKRMSFSSIYSHFVFKEPTLTVSVPIYKNNDLVGVLGVDFLMTWLNSILRRMPIGPNGQIFIIDENKNLVATTTGEEIFLLKNGKSENIKIENSKNLLTKEIMTKYNEKTKKIKLNNKEYLVGKDSFISRGVSWDIYTVILKDDFSGDIKGLLLEAFISVLLVSLLFVLTTLLIIVRLINPILKLNESAKNLSLGIYQEVPLLKDENEIYELTENFNAMGMKLTNLLNHLSSEVKKRTFELEQKNKILKKYSYIDELMQIPNRRRFDEAIAEVMDLSSRNGRPIGLMMIDIDNFKDFNDTYGHIAGDTCLKKVGITIKNCVKRKTDLAARYGGEELVVIVQELGFDDTINIAEKIRQNIKELNIENIKSPSGFVTVSIGVLYGNIEPSQTPEEIIEFADELMYTAKKRGKNRIEVMELSNTLIKK